MTLTQRRAKPFSPFPAGYLHYPCFLLGFLYLHKWIPHCFGQRAALCCQQAKVTAFQFLGSCSCSQQWVQAELQPWVRGEGLDRLGSRHFNTKIEGAIPQVFLYAPHFWENVLYTPTGSGQPESQPGRKASISPYFLFWKGILSLQRNPWNVPIAGLCVSSSPSVLLVSRT